MRRSDLLTRPDHLGRRRVLLASECWGLFTEQMLAKSCRQAIFGDLVQRSRESWALQLIRIGIRGGVFGTVTRLRVVWPGIRMPEESNIFYSPNPPIRFRGPTNFLLNVHGCSFSGIKRQGREADTWPSWSADLKNKWRHTSRPPIRLHGVDRNNFTLLLFLIYMYSDVFK